MTSAKPHSMAAQTEAPDDLIAELARLMADEARNDQSEPKVEPAPLRIPGAPQPDPAPLRAETRSAPKPVRIPGGENDAPMAAEPFNFDFSFAPNKVEAGPTSPISADPIEPTPEPATIEPPEQEPPAQDMAPLDQDSLADLIAAELASDLPAPKATEPSTPPASELESSAKGEDSFGMPPIFGLGSNSTSAPPAKEDAPAPKPSPAAAAPATERATEAKSEPLDPLDEIERLVGPALRASTPQPAPASPALRSLATPTIAVPTAARAERVESVKPQPQAPAAADQGASLTSVDEAILAAAAATGAHVEWVNAGGGADIPGETDALAEPQRSPRRINRALAGPLMAVGLLAIAGVGLYWVLGQSGAPSGPAPLVVADTSPTKEIPEVEPTETAPQSVVFNEISGAATAEGEQLVSRDQADTEAVVAASSSTPANAGILADAGSTTVDPNQDGLVNRKVRTVTVRPDGTIVSGDDSLAGSAILPVDRPDVPEVPGADFSTPELVASAQAGNATPAAVEAPAADTATPAAPAAEPGTDIAVVDATGSAVPGVTTRMPMERPTDFASIASAAIAAANANPAPVAPAPAATPSVAQQPAATAPAGGSAAAYVQLASQRSEEAARQSAQAIATRYGVLFGGANLEIQRVDLGERGIYYRVLVPAASRDSASNICTNVKAAGGDCLLL